MAVLELPRTLTLPSGTRVTLTRRRTGAIEPRVAKAGEPLFSEAREVLAHDIRIERAAEGTTVEVDELALGDFHVLRAVVTRAGFLGDEEVELDCRNCGALVVARPCERLELGPWLDGELDDPELDHTFEFGAPIDIATCRVAMGRDRQVDASTVTLGPRTVGEVAPMFAALARDPVDIDEPFVTAMGIRALGPLSEPASIARALSDASDETFASVTEAFLASHYSLRLASDVLCTSCKARTTMIAPALREFEIGLDASPVDEARPSTAETFPPLPPLEEFVELAHAIAEPLIAEIPGEKAVLLVEDGTPAVDDGGVPLLGSYVPPPPKDLPVPMTPPTVTVYYRTFLAIERDEGPYDWHEELTETIEHELEHHVFFLRGDDPMDEEEHAEIDRDVVRIVGRDETTRRALVGFGQSIPEFWRRAWPLVLVGAAVLGISIAEGYCGGAAAP